MQSFINNHLNYAKKYKTDKVNSEDYFNTYYAILILNEKSEENKNKRKSTKDSFDVIKDVVLGYLRRDF